MPLPLHDVRVLAIERYGAGPCASLQLADLGAEVIKIEDPLRGGDVGRHVPPIAAEEDALFLKSFSRNLTSISLAIFSESGREVLERLVSNSDVVSSKLRGDLPGRLGL